MWLASLKFQNATEAKARSWTPPSPMQHAGTLVILVWNMISKATTCISVHVYDKAEQ